MLNFELKTNRIALMASTIETIDKICDRIDEIYEAIPEYSNYYGIKTAIDGFISSFCKKLNSELASDSDDTDKEDQMPIAISAFLAYDNISIYIAYIDVGIPTDGDGARAVILRHDIHKHETTESDLSELPNAAANNIMSNLLTRMPSPMHAMILLSHYNICNTLERHRMLGVTANTFIEEGVMVIGEMTVSFLTYARDAITADKSGMSHGASIDIPAGLRSADERRDIISETFKNVKLLRYAIFTNDDEMTDEYFRQHGINSNAVTRSESEPYFIMVEGHRVDITDVTLHYDINDDTYIDLIYHKTTI